MRHYISVMVSVGNNSWQLNIIIFSFLNLKFQLPQHSHTSPMTLSSRQAPGWRWRARPSESPCLRSHGWSTEQRLFLVSYWTRVITLDITLDVGFKVYILMCLSLTSGWKLKTLFYWRYTAVDEHGQAKHSSGLNLSLLEDQNFSKFDLNKFSDGLSTTCEGRLFHSVITLWVEQSSFACGRESTTEYNQQNGDQPY